MDASLLPLTFDLFTDSNQIYIFLIFDCLSYESGKLTKHDEEEIHSLQIAADNF